jgi:hypothetical protein
VPQEADPPEKTLRAVNSKSVKQDTKTRGEEKISSVQKKSLINGLSMHPLFW